MLEEIPQAQDQSQTQTHSHDQEHEHDHGHVRGHGHQHGADAWSGEDYMARPGVREVALISHDSVIHTLAQAGLTEVQMTKMNLVEIGCGGGAVTPHFARSFATVHALDTSPSMLLAFSTHLPPSNNPTVSYALHALSSSSPIEFANQTPMYSPTRDDNERKLPSPRSRFDLAVANMVVHHVDNLDGFMSGLTGLLEDGGWVVFTEFGKEEGDRDVAGDIREEKRKASTMANGSVNAPGHYHASFTPESISALLEKHGFVDVFAEIRGTMPVFGPGKPEVPCLIVRGRKAGASISS